MPGKIPHTSVAAMTAGLTRMGSPSVDVVVAEDFVKAVRDITADAGYHDDRDGGLVAARTVTAVGGNSVVVANWPVLTEMTDAEVERVLAHEAGHVSIDSRTESPWGHDHKQFAGHWWNQQLAYAAALAVDEYRCEAAVYAAGYPTGMDVADADVADDLFSLNIALLHADDEYQSHEDVARLRLDVLKTVAFHVQFMGKMAARCLHLDPIDPSGMNKFARANWEAFVEPTWTRFLDVYRAIPQATSPWAHPAPTDAVVELVSGIASLVTSFGYEATENEFFDRLSDEDVQARLDRANAEADLLGHTP